MYFVLGYVSYRSKEKGTMFIQSLCDCIRKDGNHKSIEDIMKDVNKQLTERFSE